MKLFFNELATNYIAKDIESAHKWLSTFFEICDQVRERSQRHVSVVTTIKFTNIYIHSNTSFAQWISTLDDLEYKRRILSMVTRSPVVIEYPYYYYERKACQGLGMAYEEDEISVSYGVEYWMENVLEISRERFDRNDEVEVNVLTVKHISSVDHLDYYVPVRKFLHNPKHDRVHRKSNKGEKVSILECSDEDAQKYLCYAIGEATANDKQLFYYDERVSKFLIFYRHIDGEYHGYHTDDENEVPINVRSKLEKGES